MQTIANSISNKQTNIQKSNGEQIKDEMDKIALKLDFYENHDNCDSCLMSTYFNFWFFFYTIYNTVVLIYLHGRLKFDLVCVLT